MNIELLACPGCRKPVPAHEAVRHAIFCLSDIYEALAPQAGGAASAAETAGVGVCLACDACGAPADVLQTYALDSTCGHTLCHSCVHRYAMHAAALASAPPPAAAAGDENATPPRGASKQAAPLAGTAEPGVVLCPADGGRCGRAVPYACVASALAGEARALAALERAQLLTALGSAAVVCPNSACGAVYEPVPPTPGKAVPRTPLRARSAVGAPLTPRAHAHHAAHRLRCRDCEAVFCAACGAQPYHTGLSCEAHARRASARLCRFCGEALDSAAAAAAAAEGSGEAAADGGDDEAEQLLAMSVCADARCQRRARLACRKTLACGHACAGVRNEAACLGCFACGPAEGDAAPLPSGEDYCALCWVDALASGPCVRLACGHVFHYECVHKQLDPAPGTGPLVFDFLRCSLCQAPVAHAVLARRLARHHELRADTVALLRHSLLQEGEADAATMDEEAVLRLCVAYACSKCAKPFYGGRAVCAVAGGEDEGEHGPQRLCPACSDQPPASCAKHGTRYMQYKCRFCCSLATWFCWGNTHFCEPCHAQAPGIARRKLALLPPCTCGRPHPPNGTVDFAVACIACAIST